MAVSKAQQKAVAKYMAANYDEIKVRVPKGERDKIKSCAEQRGESLNGYITAAIAQRMERDGGQGPEGLTCHESTVKNDGNLGSGRTKGLPLPCFSANFPGVFSNERSLWKTTEKWKFTDTERV